MRRYIDRSTEPTIVFGDLNATPEAADPDEDRAAKTTKEHLSPGDHEALDRLVSGQGR